jgi:hypothetical protein
MAQQRHCYPNESFSTIQHVWAYIAPDLHLVTGTKRAPIRDYAQPVMRQAFAVAVTREKVLPRKTGNQIHIPPADGLVLATRETITDRRHFVNPTYARVVMAAQAKHCVLDVIR